MSDAAAVQKAKTVLQDNYVQDFPVDVFDLASKYGLWVERRLFPSDLQHISGFIELDGNDKPRVILNASDSSNRQKFTMAHELGHWLLHKDDLRNNPNLGILFRIPLGRLNTDPKEREANIFAGDLLVPEDRLRQAYEVEHKTIEQLADMFGVSKEVIGYRVDQLSRSDRNGQALGQVENHPSTEQQE